MADEKLFAKDYDRLHRALTALGDEPGSTAFGDATIKAARGALFTLQMTMVQKLEDDQVPISDAIKDRGET